MIRPDFLPRVAPALSGSPPDPVPPSVMQGMSDWRPALLARWLRCSAGGTGSAGYAGRSRALPPTKRGRTAHRIETERSCGARTSAWWPKLVRVARRFPVPSRRPRCAGGLRPALTDPPACTRARVGSRGKPGPCLTRGNGEGCGRHNQRVL